MISLAPDVLAPFAREASSLVESLRRSVVLIHDGRGAGSGLIWDGAGLVVTNHHVVAHRQAGIELADGRRLTATVVARDPDSDLAALRVPASGLPAAPLGDSTALRVGHLIIAVGNPFGVQGTATLGIISGLGRPIGMGQAQRELIQADVDLAPGSSGGPLANAAGEVVGLASMVVSPGIAIAVPIHVVRRFLATVP